VIDTVFSLEEFARLMRMGGGLADDVRICTKYKPSGDIFVKCQVIVSVGLYSVVTGQPRKVLRCIVSERSFNYHFITSPHENREKTEYKAWLKEAYEKAEQTLGFKPIEGVWTWRTEEEEA